MKIEKLTDNKIRVIIDLDDFKKNNIDIHSFLSRTLDSQSLFLDILKKAEEEVDFRTDGCKLLIEAFSSSDDVLVFTITKYSPSDLKSSLDSVKNKKLISKYGDIVFEKSSIHNHVIDILSTISEDSKELQDKYR